MNQFKKEIQKMEFKSNNFFCHNDGKAKTFDVQKME